MLNLNFLGEQKKRKGDYIINNKLPNYSITLITSYGSRMNEIKEQLEKSIQFAKYRLKQFSAEKLSTETTQVAYNKLLIEKAVLVKELELLNENRFRKNFSKFWRKIMKKKLICDSF